MTKNEEFLDLCKPLIKYINDNYHPHTTIIIDSIWWELLEGSICCRTEEFIRW